MNELLLEKRRYGLPEVITDKEQELLEQGMPVQKIIGFIDFDDLKIKINKDVLIPRYETQEVVIKAMEYINGNTKVLDLCAGSGYIGLTVKQKTNANVTLSDITDEAIEQIIINAADNQLNVNVIKSDMFDSIPDKFDVIISNPPYIPIGNILDQSVTKYDPHLALFGGVDGNDFYKIIIEEAPKHLNNKGVLILEISNDNSKFIKSHGFKTIKDINGKDRIAIKEY